MHPNPENIQKYLYIEKTSTWKVRSFYLFGLISWILAVYGLSGIFLLDPFFTYYVTPIILIFTFYYFISYGINLFYCQFNLIKHFKFIEEFWPINTQPPVDIFLPIYGEDISILRNTWEHVSKLYYNNKKVYVLDDSQDDCEEHKKLAGQYGFTYFERPNKGEMKNSSVGIVQTPQYFETSKVLYKKSPLAYAAAYQDEYFYRIIQVAKDRFNAAICCGSNSIFRRKALLTIGGFRQVSASEDTRSGYSLLSKGWITRYIPIILAVGICPSNVYAYYHQQHRWCRGRSELTLSKEFLLAPVSFIKKVCFLSGFLMFLNRPLKLLLSFHLFWILFLYNDSISLGNSYIFYFYITFIFIIDPFFHLASFKKETFLISMIKIYASTHAILSVLMGKTVSWIPTNSKHSKISTAFLQTNRIVMTYLSIYLILILLTIRTGDLHIFNHNYWSIQFWMFWNLGLTSILLWQFLREIKRMKTEQDSNYKKIFINEFQKIYFPRLQTANSL